MTTRTKAPPLDRLRKLLARGAPKLLRDFAVLAGGQLVSKVIALAVFAYLARKLDPEGYGAVEYIVGLAGMLLIAIGCGLGTIGVRRVAANHEELPALASGIPVIRFAIALVVVPILVFAVGKLGPASLPRELVWLYAASLLLAAWNQEWLLQSAELMTQVAVALTLRVLVFAAVVLLLVSGPADVASVGWAELAAAAAATAYYLRVQHRRVTPVRIAVDTARLPGLAREGVAVGLGQFVWTAAQYLPLFIVGSVIGGAETGWFGAAQRLATSIAMFSFVYHFNLYPALARAATRSRDELADLMRISFRVTSWLGIGLALGIALAAPTILTLLFGERFGVAAPALSIIIWTVPVIFLSGHARWSLIVASAQTKVLYAQVAGLVTVALAGVVLVQPLGYVGAAAAAVAGTLAVWITAHALARAMGLPSPAFSLALRPCVLAAVAAGATLWAGLHGIAAALAGCTLYAAFAPLLDRALLPDLIRLAHVKGSRTEPAK